jgi:hypothetical protein
MTVDELPCQVCGISEGSDMLVCGWCGSGAGHLECLGLAEVPEGVWCCGSMCAEHKGEAEAAAELAAPQLLSNPSVKHRVSRSCADSNSN